MRAGTGSRAGGPGGTRAGGALAAVLGAVGADGALWSDFLALCDLGGRLAGGPGEAAAVDLAQARLRAVDPGGVGLEEFPYTGWACRRASLTLVEGDRPLACRPLLGARATPPGGLVAEVLDLGRGTPEQFAAHAAAIPGRVVLVRHEYMFAAGHLHRMRKYRWALERGAAGLLVASPFPGGGPVGGGTGREGGAGLPALGVDGEGAARLAAAGAGRVRLVVEAEDRPARAPVLSLDLPGRGASRVVVSAHLDGHDLAESALDNATGVAVALALARALAPRARAWRRGLRVCLFGAEEWGLIGSREYLDRMDPGERGRLALDVNLDTVAGDSRLTALTSGFPRLDGLVAEACGAVGLPLPTYRPTMANSDHYHFARHGIPALRLVAGFDRPGSGVRHVLTAADTRDKVAPGELKAAALAAAALAWRGLTAPAETLSALGEGREAGDP
jgi:hypothetical protein